jgi:hypothetical protein
MPSLTVGSTVGDGSPIARWRAAIAASRRRTVVARHLVARSATYAVTSVGVEGSAQRSRAAHQAEKSAQSDR